MKEPRGIRNRNPGNIERTQNPKKRWQGELEKDPSGQERRFAVFDTAENGIRAIAKLKINYGRLYGLTTVAGQVGRWAPPGENNTRAYVAAVEKAVRAAGFDPDHLELDNPRCLKALVVAVIWHENGQQPYPDSVIDNAIRRALG